MNGQFNWDSSVIDRSRVVDGYLFATQRDRCLYLGKSARDRLHWLKENPGKWQSLEVEQEVARLRPAVESETNLEAGLAEPNRQASSHDVRKDGGEESDVTLVDTPLEGCSSPYQPTSLPVPVPAIIERGTTKTEPLRPAAATRRETKGPKTETTPLGAMGRKRGRSGGRQLKKKKPPAGISKAGPKHSPERMRIVLNSLRKFPILSHAARKAGIHRKTLEYWMKCSEAGHDGYDIKWQGEKWRFHEHCKSAIDEAHDRLDAVRLQMALGVIVKTDENGNFIEEACGQPNTKMLRYFLELRRPEKWGKHPKIDIPQKGGVLVIGDVTKKPKYNAAASVRARQWKSCSRKIREAKA